MSVNFALTLTWVPSVSTLWVCFLHNCASEVKYVYIFIYILKQCITAVDTHNHCDQHKVHFQQLWQPSDYVLIDIVVLHLWNVVQLLSFLQAVIIRVSKCCHCSAFLLFFPYYVSIFSSKGLICCLLGGVFFLLLCGIEAQYLWYMDSLCAVILPYSQDRVCFVTCQKVSFLLSALQTACHSHHLFLNEIRCSYTTENWQYFYFCH